MSFRRHHIDRVNPRFVPPSRHTIFIRGLPGSTNVDAVKNHFCNETNSKCTVEFFSTSEDKVRFSVAIRFNNHDLAQEMLEKYNGKELLGHQVEVSWFKDLKKARARVYEEQRNSRFRTPRGGFRGGHRGFPERRGRYSPSRGRDRSHSGGPPSGRREGTRGSVSSRSSNTRSGSQPLSPKRRRISHDDERDSAQGTRRFSRGPRRRFSRSRSGSSRSRSYSRSVSNRSMSHRDNQPERRGSFANRDSGPRRPPQPVRTPVGSRASFSNAQPPSGGDNGENGLLSGLIQLNSKRMPAQPSQFRESVSHSRSASSRSYSRSLSPRRRQNRNSNRSPVARNPISSVSKSPSPAQQQKPKQQSAALIGSNWKPLSFSEEISKESGAKGSLFAAYGGSGGKPVVTNGKIILSPLTTEKNRPVSPEDVHSGSMSISRESSPAGNQEANATTFRTETQQSNVVKNSLGSADKQTLIQQKKEAIEEEYKKDCETFATVVKIFISKDEGLEERLLPLLKTILHERGQKSVEDLKVYIDSLEKGGAC